MDIERPSSNVHIVTEENVFEFVQLVVFAPFTQKCRERVNVLILAMKTEQCSVSTLL